MRTGKEPSPLSDFTEDLMGDPKHPHSIFEELQGVSLK